MSDKQVDLAEQFLSDLEIPIRLDLHGVLDKTDPNEKIADLDTIVVSYVGKLTQTRVGARNDIIKRLKSSQIQMGFLVFKRSRDNSYNFHEPGSKAWLNKLVKFGDKGKALFVDDSQDHYASVKSLNLKGMTSYWLKKGSSVDKLYKVIKEFEK